MCVLNTHPDWEEHGIIGQKAHHHADVCLVDLLMCLH